MTMKKIFYSVLLALLVTSCGSDSKTSGKKNDSADITKDPDYAKGLTLVADNGCLACHRVDELVTGPSYREIANKYANGADTAVSYLASKIIKGGTGVWGTAFMTPNSNLSKDEAETIVRYILLLKNK